MSARSVWLLTAAFLLAGKLQLAAAEPKRAASNSEPYDRQTNRFAQAWLFKPHEPKAPDLSYTLAPLILQEVSGTSESSRSRFGELEVSNGVPAVQYARPVVYVKPDAVELNGRTHARFTYLWFYAASLSGSAIGQPPVQGVRITLDESGRPAIWEVLAEPTGARLIFVAHSVEAPALKEHGSVLRGRRHAVERAPEDLPNVFVARVIEDGPVPMGPILYLRARTSSVSTLICRCMPAQAEQVVGSSTYDLLSAEGVPFEQVLATLEKNGRISWKGSQAQDPVLDRLLRLPSSF